MTGEPAVADISALSACRLLRIHRESFSRLIAGNPKTLAKFARLITEQMLRAARAVAQADLQRKAHCENQDPYDLNFSSASEAMKILVLNSGSSSLKYSLYDTSRDAALIDGEIEKIGSGEAVHRIKTLRIDRKEAKEGVKRVESNLYKYKKRILKTRRMKRSRER